MKKETVSRLPRLRLMREALRVLTKDELKNVEIVGGEMTDSRVTPPPGGNCN